MPLVRPLLALALLPALLPAAGCESCDFSFGPIAVVVEPTPFTRPLRITVCAEDQDCETRMVAPNAEPEALQFDVDWHGYAVCKVPRVEVEVEVDGCAPQTVTRDRHRPSDPGNDAQLVVPVELVCG